MIKCGYVIHKFMLNNFPPFSECCICYFRLVAVCYLLTLVPLFEDECCKNKGFGLIFFCFISDLGFFVFRCLDMIWEQTLEN